MTWVLSDGTEVDLGGVVRGASLFAQECRDVLSGRYGPPSVAVYPQPADDIVLDVNDPTLLEKFLSQQARGSVDKVIIVSAPSFERRVFPQQEDNTPLSAVN